nr:ribonuclease H-like domain-containing protein [Tanacetum cinerariifolium]
MTGNKCYLIEYEDYDGGFVSFGDGKGRISRKGKIETGTLDFDDVYFYKELNLAESSKEGNIYSVDLKSVVPTGGLTCLFPKAITDESNLWRMRLGHINYKTMNKLVKGNLDLKDFITGIENQLGCKVKVIRCDNRIEFKNSIMNQFCDIKGIKREFSTPRTPRQNGVAEKKNRTLIKAARTMLVDSKLPTTFWAEVVNTACYVLNRALVIKPHNKTPYELIRGRPPLIDFMKPIECPVTILNTRDYLAKFDEKADEVFFVWYTMVSKAIRVFNKRTRIAKETLNIRFLENAPNVKGNGPDWLFDINSLTISMNYVPVVAGFQTNGIAGTKDNFVAGQAEKKKEPEQEYILIPICTTDPLISQGPKDSAVDAGKKATKVDASQVSNNGSSPVSTAGPSFVNASSPLLINVAGTHASTNAFEEHPFK